MRFTSLGNLWLINWEPGLNGAPSREDVAALLASNPVASLRTWHPAAERAGRGHPLGIHSYWGMA